MGCTAATTTNTTFHTPRELPRRVRMVLLGGYTPRDGHSHPVAVTPGKLASSQYKRCYGPRLLRLHVGIVNLLRYLDGEARKHGGSVYMLNGNHESLNVCGDFRWAAVACMHSMCMPVHIRGAAHRGNAGLQRQGG